MRMRRLARVLLFALPLTIAYLGWPVYTALEIRDAIVAGDTATLERRVDWPALRAAVKASLTPETAARLMADPDAPKPTLWQRVKAAVAPSMADSVVERYVTAENLPLLFGYRRPVQSGGAQPSSSLVGPPSALAGSLLAGSSVDRFASFWTRLRRAVFYSPTRFEVEVEDKDRPGRHYVGTLELKGFEWKLTSLAIAGGSF
jgi:hypothetical protein